MAPLPRPYTLAVPDAAIADLRARLALTRLPTRRPASPGPMARMSAISAACWRIGKPASTGARRKPG